MYAYVNSLSQIIPSTSFVISRHAEGGGRDILKPPFWVALLLFWSADCNV